MRKTVIALATVLLVLFASWVMLYPSMAGAAEIKLKWNPNIERDLAGYKMYLGEKSGGPWTLLGTSPTAIAPEFVYSIPTATEKQLFFVVTAYDNAGNESGYSNETGIYVDNVAPGAPLGLQITIIISLPVNP